LSLAAFGCFGGLAIFGFLSVDRNGFDQDVGNELLVFLLTSWIDLGLVLLAVLCGLVGLALTLTAGIFGIVRASRTHQWGWLAAILIGTVLPLPTAVVALDVVYPASPPIYGPNPLQQVLPFVFGLVCMPLAVWLYSVVGWRSGVGATPVPSRTFVSPDMRVWLGGVGVGAAVALTLVSSGLAANWLPSWASPAPPMRDIRACVSDCSSFENFSYDMPTSVPVDCTQGLQHIGIDILNPGGGILAWVAHTDDPDVQLHPSFGRVYGNNGSDSSRTLNTGSHIAVSGASHRSQVTTTFQSNAGDWQVVLQCLASP
jgi:hypothetical protein